MRERGGEGKRGKKGGREGGKKRGRERECVSVRKSIDYCLCVIWPGRKWFTSG